jgi:hypothetical protein
MQCTTDENCCQEHRTEKLTWLKKKMIWTCFSILVVDHFTLLTRKKKQEHRIKLSLLSLQVKYWKKIIKSSNFFLFLFFSFYYFYFLFFQCKNYVINTLLAPGTYKFSLGTKTMIFFYLFDTANALALELLIWHISTLVSACSELLDGFKAPHCFTIRLLIPWNEPSITFFSLFGDFRLSKSFYLFI